jgi:prephenate dehydrogenase
MSSSNFKINKLAIIGVGLIGGSLAIALRQAGVVRQIVGCGRGKANLEKAVELEVIDEFTHDVAEAVSGADLVFVAVPLGAMKTVFKSMAAHLKPDAVVTDGGSAKACVIQDWIDVFGNDSQFVAGHPIAGTENSGVEAALPDLYQSRRIILTPTASVDPEAVKRVESMWQSCGSEVTHMSVELHDQVLAATSHLPHVLAFGLVDSLDKLETHDEIFKYAAGGFRDFSRIASSNPVMWRDICVANHAALTPVLDSFIDDLQNLSAMIKSQDGDALLKVFQDAKQARDDFIDGLSD